MAWAGSLPNTRVAAHIAHYCEAIVGKQTIEQQKQGATDHLLVIPLDIHTRESVGCLLLLPVPVPAQVPPPRVPQCRHNQQDTQHANMAEAG